MQSDELRSIVISALEDVKAQDVCSLDVRGLTSITDHMVLATGTSDRHVRALADRVAEAAKEHDVCPLGVEGEHEGEWVLVDLSDVVVHIMLPEIRNFYNLEKLWGDTEQKVSADRSARTS